MMDRKPVRNVYSSIPKINLRNWCISLVLLSEYVRMRGPLNVKFVNAQGQIYTSNVIFYVSIPKSNSENVLQRSLCPFLNDILNLS